MIRRAALRLCLAAVLTAAASVRAAVVVFDVNPAQSNATVAVDLDTPAGMASDSDTSTLDGTITGIVANPDAPFGTFQIIDLEIMTAQSAELSFCFAQIGPFCLGGVDVTAAPNDLTVTLVEAGPPAPVVGNAFTQIDNAIALGGTINVDATGLAEGQIPEGPFLLDSDPFLTDLTGTITRTNNTFNLTINLMAMGITEDEMSGVVTEYSLIGTVNATGQIVVIPGDLDCSGAVTIDDAPHLVDALLDDGGFSGCDIELADVNNDSNIDGRDLQAFIDALL